MNKVFFSLSLFLLLPLKIFHCVYLYAYMCVCAHISMYVWIYMHVCAHVSVYVCVRVNIYACVCAYIYVCLYVYMCVCLCRSEGKLWESVSPFTRASVSRKQAVKLDIENLLPLNHWTPSRALLLSLAVGPANTKSKSSTFLFLSAPPSPFRFSVSAHGHGSQLVYLFTVSVIPVIGFPSKLGRTDMNPTYLAFQQYFPPSYFLRVFPLSSLFPLIL